MVRVIGTDDRLRRETTCRNCAARLEYYPRDVQERMVSDYGGGSDRYQYILCAGCGREVAASR